jgi:hypothetical protein
MKNFTIAIALAFASLGAAQAQDTNAQYGVPATMGVPPSATPQNAAPQKAAPQYVAPQYAAPQKAAQQGKVRPVLGMGLTFGGDKLATAEYENGGSIDDLLRRRRLPRHERFFAAGNDRLPRR